MRCRSGFCNHYRAMSQHATCEAGVSYEQFKGKPHSDVPCFFEGEPPTEKSPLCELALYPTPEQLAERDAEIKKRFEGMVKARKAIVDYLGGPWKRGMGGSAGSILCPVCGSGTLRFTRSSYNGHIHAACSSQDCVSWME